MTDDPIRQADIERRLANLAKAPRCGARTRTGSPCRQAAVSGRARCRINAALAIIDSMQCRSELEALMAVEIVATEFSGLRFLRQSHKNQVRRAGKRL
jgi:hypothetical protein